MTNPVEAMARAILNHDEKTWENLHPVQRRTARKRARAALKALKDNTSTEMHLAGIATLDEMDDPETPIYCNSDRESRVFDAMLSVAMKEETDD